MGGSARIVRMDSDAKARADALHRSTVDERLASVLLLTGVLLVFGAPVACIMAARTAGDSFRMALTAIAAELIGAGVSAGAVNILKKVRAEGSSRSPTRFALAAARVAFWGSILIAALLSLAALFFLAMSFGLSS